MGSRAEGCGREGFKIGEAANCGSSKNAGCVATVLKRRRRSLQAAKLPHKSRSATNMHATDRGSSDERDREVCVCVSQALRHLRGECGIELNTETGSRRFFDETQPKYSKLECPK